MKTTLVRLAKPAAAYLVFVGLVSACVVALDWANRQDPKTGQWAEIATWAAYAGLVLAALLLIWLLRQVFRGIRSIFGSGRSYVNYSGPVLPVGRLIERPGKQKATGMLDWGVGLADGAFVFGFARDLHEHSNGMVEDFRLPFEDLRHIAVQVRDDADIQNTAVSGIVSDSAINAISRVKVRSIPTGAYLILFVETAPDRIERYSFAVPATIGAGTIRAYSKAVSPAVDPGDGTSLAAGGLAVADAFGTIAEIVQTGDLAAALPSSPPGLGQFAGFLASIGQAAQATGTNARLAAALMAVHLQRHAPHAPVTHHEWTNEAA